MTEMIEFRRSQLTWHQGVAEFCHRNGTTRNAMSEALRRDYADMIEVVREQRQTRVLILTGSDGSFCAGGDIRAMQERLDSDDPELNSPDATRRRIEAANAWLVRLRELDIPILAAVDGPAYGAGFCLALQADLLVASTRASFCMSFAKVGCLPDFGAFHSLPRWIGLARAKDLMLTARRLGAAEAASIGLVHSLHEPNALLPQARAFAARLASGPREALALTRKLLNQSFDTDYHKLAAMESSAQAVCMATSYHAESVARFVAGQPPLFDWDQPAQSSFRENSST